MSNRKITKYESKLNKVMVGIDNLSDNDLVALSNRLHYHIDSINNVLMTRIGAGKKNNGGNFFKGSKAFNDNVLDLLA